MCPLYGALPFEQQQAAIAPDAEGRRRVVLSTNLAESSLTIEGVRVVVDALGPPFEPRIEEMRAALANAPTPAARVVQPGDLG